MLKASPLSRSLQRVPLALWVFLTVFAFQFLLVNLMADSKEFLPSDGDMRFYNDWALRVLNGQFTDGKAFYGLPGYAFLLAGLYKITGGYSQDFSPFVVGQVQAAVHALTAVFIYLLGRLMIQGDSPDLRRRQRWVGLIAAAGWATFTPAQAYTAIVMPTCWAVCGLWGVLWFVVRTFTLGRASWLHPWLLVGIVMGVMAMMVASVFAVLPLLLIAIILSTRAGFAIRGRLVAALAGIAMLMLGIFAGMAPVWYHNYFIAHDSVLLTSHDGINYYLGNNPSANGYPRMPNGLRASQAGLMADSLEIPERELGRPLRRSEASAYWKSKADEFIRNNPLAWMRLLAHKFENFWNFYQYDDISILLPFQTWKLLPPGLSFGWVAVLAVPGMLVGWLYFPRSRWLTSAVLLQMAILLWHQFITERYRLAAVPGLLILASLGVVWAWQALASARWRRIIPYALIAVGTAWFVSIPRPEPEFWTLNLNKLGSAETAAAAEATARNEPTEAALHAQRAQVALEKAVGYVPGPENFLSLGNVWFGRHDLERAQACYTVSLQFSNAAGKQNVEATNNLGAIAVERKQWAEAEQYFLETLRLDPTDVPVWLRLAQCRKESGNLAGAEDALRHALELRPGDAGLQALLNDVSPSANRPPPK